MKPRPAIALAALVGLSSNALAQEGQSSAAPAAWRGFVFALGTGYTLPMGKATGGEGDDLSKTFGGQVQITGDLGVKPSDSFFFGGYIRAGGGREGSAWKTLCSYTESGCWPLSLRVGAQLHYQFLPDRTFNPWIGYGIGREFVRLSGEGNGNDIKFTASGFEFAHVMGGLILRHGKDSSSGRADLYGDLAIGQYDSYSLELGGVKRSGKIENKAVHQWLTFGLRVWLWP